MKTITQWLEELPEPSRSLALLNRKENPLYEEKEVDSMQEAIGSAFSWAHSPEGICYWNSIYESYKEK